MELRVLRYFLEVAREGNMTRAAERLHITQPTLSRQIRDLEAELGKKLFVRHNTSVSLTDEGVLLRKRAEDLLSIATKIEDEFHSMDEIVGGRISIGCAESHLIRYLAEAVGSLRSKHPGITYSITSGGTEQVDERLRTGVLDLAIIVEPPDLARYNYIEFPESDVWGVYMTRDCPLANKEYLTIEDIQPYPLFCSEQSVRADLPRWAGDRVDSLNIIANFNLASNSFVFTRAGIGLSLSFKEIIEVVEDSASGGSLESSTKHTGGSSLVFRPLYPELANRMYVIWNKHQVLTPAAALLLDEIRAVVGPDRL